MDSRHRVEVAVLIARNDGMGDTGLKTRPYKEAEKDGHDVSCPYEGGEPAGCRRYKIKRRDNGHSMLCPYKAAAGAGCFRLCQ